jgi:hypothetical protein
MVGMTAFAGHLAELGHLRADVSAEHARDVLWTLSSPDVWDLLVRQRGWTLERYQTFVSQQLIAALLPLG